MARQMISRKLLSAIALLAIAPVGLMAHSAQANEVHPQGTVVKGLANRGTAKDLGAVITLPEEVLQQGICYLERIDGPNGSYVTLSSCEKGGQQGLDRETIEQFNLRIQVEKRGFEEIDRLKLDLLQF